MKLAIFVAVAVLAASTTTAAQQVRFEPKVRIGAEPPPLMKPQADPRPAGARVTHQAARTKGRVVVVGQEDREVICGMTVMRQRPDADKKIMLPSDRSKGAAVRRIEPQVCNGAR